MSDDGVAWSNLSGEIRQSFTPRERHVGRQLRVQLSYVDGQGNLETILSPPSSPVQNVNDKPNGAPQLVGAAMEEDALVVDTSMISDDDGLGNFSIVWQRSSTKTDWQAFPKLPARFCRCPSVTLAIPIVRLCPTWMGTVQKNC